MHAIAKLVRFILMGGAASMLALPGCTQNIPVDLTGGDIPPAGIISGTVNYLGPPPCSQAGHVFGNAILLVFDARNPPPPAGLGVTAANFGVVSGDVLFKDYPVTQGATKICPAANAAPINVSAPYAISPMNAGQYVIQAFFDYTNDFLATFKFRQLPEATDIGGGYIDVLAAQQLVANPYAPPDAGPVEQQALPGYVPTFLPVKVGTQGATPSTSLLGVPTFTMPDTGYVADNITVTIGAKLTFSRPYFYPTGVSQSFPPISNIQIYEDAGSAVEPPATKTDQNPTGDPDFVPIVSFPQDIQVYAQPNAAVATLNMGQYILEYQAALPMVRLNAGVAAPEEQVAANDVDPQDPFHMQLGLEGGSYAPGGNGGIYVWWNGNYTDADCGNVKGCAKSLEFIPENPEIYRMWPLVVLAKLQDLPKGGAQPNTNDPQGIVAQGSKLEAPVVIIQGITLAGDPKGVVPDSFLTTSVLSPAVGVAQPLLYPDVVHNTNLQDHVSFLVRPSALCLDPRAPDNGGILVTPGNFQSQSDGTYAITGNFPPGDPIDTASSGIVIDDSIGSNPQLSTLVNTKLGHNGIVGGCIPTGRYQINLVYPTGQAWTTPNESGACATLEGSTQLTNDPGSCSIANPRKVLRSQGTRAVVEVTTATPGSCAAGGAGGGAVPYACTTLCTDQTKDPTANPPCSKALP